MTFNSLCNFCTNIGCEFQSGIVRTECTFYMPPQPRIESDNCGNYVVMQPTVNAILIPKNATNGEVIQTLFPNASVYEHGVIYSVNNEYDFSSTWWNAPYKAESEDNV